MSDARYYLVGENDVWMVQFGDCERAMMPSPLQSLRHKSSACKASQPMYAWSMIMAASDTNGPMIGIIV